MFNYNNKIKQFLIFGHSYKKSVKFILTLSKDLEEILIGLMLGDLFAEKLKPNSNTRLQPGFKQPGSNKNKEYIHHLYSLFKDYCGSEPKITSSFDNRSNKQSYNISIKFWTFSLPCFNKFRDIFYRDGVKYIPSNLEDLITALAYWAMDDGYKFGNGFYFCTESYSFDDNIKLKDILKNKFNLDSGVHKHTNGFRLYIFSSSKDNLISLIKPFLITLL